MLSNKSKRRIHLVLSKNLHGPIDNKSIVEKVISSITNSIITGEFKKGDKIPTETELSEKLNAGRNSVREAIKVLVYLGVLEIKRADGTYVSDGFTDKMLNPLLYSLILEGDDSSNLIELRNMFEVSIVSLAIKKASIDDLRNIQEKYDAFTQLVMNNKTSEEILDADINFHVAIEEATHNPLILRLSSIITKVTIPSRLKTIDSLIQSNNSESLIETHNNILSVIKNQEHSRVLEVVDQSFVFWKNIIHENQ